MPHSNNFEIGIAGGRVTIWGLYDTLYINRYMPPQNNSEEYRKNVPLAAAKDLTGKRLLIYRSPGDKVYMQNSIQFAYELQKAGKPFQLMLYRGLYHDISALLVKHWYTTMRNFILANL